ncbi:acyl-CoA N-acyltransferase [Haematococcus lacustris]
MYLCWYVCKHQTQAVPHHMYNTKHMAAGNTQPVGKVVASAQARRPRVRRADISDAPRLREVDAACQPAGSAGWSLHSWHATLTNPSSTTIVVTVPSPPVAAGQPCSSEDVATCCHDAQQRGEEQVAAFATACQVAGEVQLENLGVWPACRGKGLGRAVLSHLLQACQCTHTGGCPCLLEVRASNQAAHRLYEAFGFQRVGLRRGMYGDGEDAALLTRPAGPIPPYTSTQALE